MRIILLNLPWRNGQRLGVRAGSRWPFTSLPGSNGYINYIPFPFFLACTASLLKKQSQEARLIDAIAEGFDEQETIEEVKSCNPQLITIETSTPSFKNDIKIIQNIIFELPNCIIVLCGPHVSVFPEQTLRENKFISYILIGEYEYTLSKLVAHLENNLSLESIPGLAYRKESEIMINRQSSTIDDLDTLPWPERNDVPIYKYNDGFAGLPQPNVQMWASRGCPFQCIFCLWPQTIYQEHRHRKRSPVDIVNEMEFLINKFNFKAVYFDDDVFNIDRNHVLGICEEIRKRKISIPWAAMARADLMDEDLLESMVSAGLYAIKYGIESADENILNLCKKNMDLNKVNSTINTTKKLGIKVHLTFCLGLPGETRDTIEKTNRFIQNTSPDSLQFSYATPFPGTEYFNYLERKGYLFSKNWSDYDGNYKCIFKTCELSAKDLERSKDALGSNFNL